MPELPEVETIRAQLDAELVGRHITAIEASWPKSLVGRGVEPAELVGRSIEGARRRGKVLIVSASGGLSALVHLRMTGQLLIEASGERLDGVHTRALVALDEGRLVFNDQRKFGRIVVVSSEEVELDPLLARMGPEPLEQSVVAGVGNIYADEILFTARIHPARRVAGLSKAAVEAIARSTTEVLDRAVAAGGSTLRDYVDAAGRRGRYLDESLVVGRRGMPCRRCAIPIEKVVVAGRGTHLCPGCQPAPARWRGRAAGQPPRASSR